MESGAKRTIMVKIGRMGSKVTEYAIENGTLIRDILKLAGIQLSAGETVTIKGNTVGIDSGALDHEIMLISNTPPPWNKITVKVARINEPLQYVTINRGSSVEQALISAGRLPFNNEDIWIHREGEDKGKKVDRYTQINNGEIIVLEPRKGLYDKVLEFVGDDDLTYNQTTSAICTMLKKDYHIE